VDAGAKPQSLDVATDVTVVSHPRNHAAEATFMAQKMR